MKIQDNDGSELVIHTNPDDYKSQPIGGVGNSYVYFMHGQDHSGGASNAANTACHKTAYPDRARFSRGNLG